MSGKLYYWVANWNLSRAQAALLLHGNVEDMVDCTHSALPQVRVALTKIKVIGGYVTGTPDIRWTPFDFNALPQDVTALSIDQSNLDLPIISHAKKVIKDVETGASTAPTAVKVAHERLSRGDDYVIYVDQSELAVVETLAASAGLPHGTIVAYQWASPSSNPNTLLPGTRLTLKEANADLTVVDRAYIAGLNPPPPPLHDLPRAIIEYDIDDGHWTATNYPWGKE